MATASNKNNHIAFKYIIYRTNLFEREIFFMKSLKWDKVFVRNSLENSDKPARRQMQALQKERCNWCHTGEDKTV